MKSRKEVIFTPTGGGQIEPYNSAKKVELLNLIYPVGSIYLSVNNVSPASFFGGTWVRWGNGRAVVGINESDSSFDTVEKIGGEKTHTLTTNEIPAHQHDLYNYSASGGSTPSMPVVVNESKKGWASNAKTLVDAGGGQSHNNLQPYITCYMWKRTA